LTGRGKVRLFGRKGKVDRVDGVDKGRKRVDELTG